MKKIFLLSMIIAGTVAFNTSDAQVRISAQININSQPDWGPAGYDYAQYYYMPDQDMYYDVASREYIYQERGRWVNVRVLPPYMRNLNFYNTYKVVVNDRNPWLRNDQHRRQYAYSRNRPHQMNWRDSRDHGHREMAQNDHRPDHYGNQGRDDRNDRYGGGRRH